MIIGKDGKVIASIAITDDGKTAWIHEIAWVKTVDAIKSAETLLSWYIKRCNKTVFIRVTVNSTQEEGTILNELTLKMIIKVLTDLGRKVQVRTVKFNSEGNEIGYGDNESLDMVCINTGKRFITKELKIESSLGD